MRYLLLTQLRQLQQREELQDINWQTVIPWTQKFANDRKDQYYWYRLAETYPHSKRAQINHMRKENWLITLESSQRLIIPVEKVWHQLEHVTEKGRHQLDHVSEGSIKLTFSIRDLESPYSFPEASDSASSSDDETPHDDYSEAPNPESSTLPQDESPFSQDGVIEQAQGDDEESWEDGTVTRQDDSEEVDTGVGLSLEARTPEYHDCMETADRSSASAAVDVPSSNSPDR